MFVIKNMKCSETLSVNPTGSGVSEAMSLLTFFLLFLKDSECMICKPNSKIDGAPVEPYDASWLPSAAIYTHNG